MITFFAIVGIGVIALIIAVGIYAIAKNVTFKETPEPYEYERSLSGEEIVKDNTDKPE